MNTDITFDSGSECIFRRRVPLTARDRASDICNRRALSVFRRESEHGKTIQTASAWHYGIGGRRLRTNDGRDPQSCLCWYLCFYDRLHSYAECWERRLVVWNRQFRNSSSG